MFDKFFYLGLTLTVLILLMAFLVARLVRVYTRYLKSKSKQPPGERDLLMETLREQTLREQEAIRSRKETTLAYEALDALHRSMMAHLPVGVLVLNQQDHVQFANPSFMSLLNVPEITGQSLADISPAMSKAVRGLRQQSLPAETAFRTEVMDVNKYLTLSLNALPENRFLLMVVDQTKERQLEERLRYKRDIELMGEMASGIAHEVKNTLAIIQGHVQMLSYGDVESHGNKIMGEIKRLLKVVREFMKSSKDEPLNLKSIHLPSWFGELDDHWSHHPRHNKVRIIQPEGGETVISGDPVLLSLVINNLVLNGIESCEPDPPQEPWVRVWLEDHPDRYTIVVEDQGPGFSSNALKKLYIPFVSSKERGSGLGLFHCRKIMMAHQGRLEVLPEPPTRVCCHFPK